MKYQTNVDKVKMVCLLVIILFITIKTTVVITEFVYGSYYLFFNVDWVENLIESICPGFFDAYEIFRYV